MNSEDRINDFRATKDERLAALKAFVDAGGLAGLPATGRESNNHIHTIYSFSPYTPAQAGLSVAGSVDHDSYAAAAEMREACRMLGLGCVTGFEVRASFRYMKFADRKINSPDSKGLAAPRSPYQRLLESEALPPEARAELVRLCGLYNPVRLQHNVNKAVLALREDVAARSSSSGREPAA
jgi:hypothetical protein